jgi:DNA-binding response OmpR family regulator
MEESRVMSDGRDLDGAQILLVEDEYFVAVELKTILGEIGARVVGPVSRLQPARDLARAERLDGAVLDVKLDGETTFPLAQELLERGVPVLFTTGFDSSILPDRFKCARCLAKPVNGPALQRMALKHFRK